MPLNPAQYFPGPQSEHDVEDDYPFRALNVPGSQRFSSTVLAPLHSDSSAIYPLGHAFTHLAFDKNLLEGHDRHVVGLP